MVENVINGLENMRLTMEEEEVITISDEGRKEEIESCSLCLLSKFLTCKPFNNGHPKHIETSLGFGEGGTNYRSRFESFPVQVQ